MLAETPTPLERLRAEAGLSQEQLAVKAGITRDTVSRIENRRSEPRLGNLFRLAKALSEILGRPVDYTDLLAGEPKEEAS